MEAYEKAFVSKMAELTKPSDFEFVVRYALRRILGESPSEVLLMTMNVRALEEPRVFVSTLSRLFGVGARSVFMSIESYVGEALQARRTAATGQSAYSTLASGIGLGKGPAATDGHRTRLLHDHRIKDEFGRYASDSD